MVFGSEVAGETTGENHGQHSCTEGHVESVEGGEHEEGRAVDSGRELQVEIGIGMAVFIGLEAQEGDAEHHREEHEERELCAFALLQRPVGERNRNARREEQQRIDRKSTRLNSSHVAISYAVFCLKKKKKE